MTAKQLVCVNCGNWESENVLPTLNLPFLGQAYKVYQGLAG
jgi:hypothetical protein